MLTGPPRRARPRRCGSSRDRLPARRARARTRRAGQRRAVGPLATSGVGPGGRLRGALAPAAGGTSRWAPPAGAAAPWPRGGAGATRRRAARPLAVSREPDHHDRHAQRDGPGSGLLQGGGQRRRGPRRHAGEGEERGHRGRPLPPTAMPEQRRAGAEPVPPDPEQQQRRERRRGQREGQPDRGGERHVDARAGPPRPARRAHRGWRPGTGDGAGVAARPPGTRSRASTPETATVRPEAVDRKAANAPPRATAPSTVPSGAGRRPAPGRSTTRVSARPGSASCGASRQASTA